MTDPITLTERERQVFAHAARTLGAGRVADDIIVSNAILHFLDADFRIRTESASPPRAPGASAPAKGAGVESGPGQPMPPYTPDIAQGLDEWAAKYSEPEDVRARCLREAAAEIRRLLARADAAEARVKALEEAARLMIAAFDGYTNKPIDDGYWRALYDAKLALIAALKEPANG